MASIVGCSVGLRVSGSGEALRIGVGNGHSG